MKPERFEAVLLLPRLRVQNANAISSPLTWGFPPPSAFTGFAHALIAYHATIKGLSKLSINPAILQRDLDNSWEVLAEPIQTVMRRYGVEQAYEKLKELTRGQSINEAVLIEFINTLDIPEQAKVALRTLRPDNYIGNAIEQARAV